MEGAFFNPRQPIVSHDVFKAHEIDDVSSETVSFVLSTGAADAGEAAGTVVYAKLDKAPVLNKLGSELGGNYATSLDTSVSFSDGVMIAAQEKSFIEDPYLDQRLSRTAARLTTNGDWALNYRTGELVVKKATTATSVSVSYKTPKLFVTTTVSGTVTVDSELPAAYSVDKSAALEAGSVISATAARLRKLRVRLDSTATSGTYYLQIVEDNAGALPADGAVTFLVAPEKIIHVSGADTYVDIDYTPGYLNAANGACWLWSTTEFTKTIITSSWGSGTALYD